MTEQQPPLVPVAIAAASGLANTLATLAITYPTRQAARNKTSLTACQKRIMYLGNLLLIGVSQVLGIWANGLGPVAVTFPFAVVANILSILLWQWHLGMLRPSKSVRIGTYTLAAAVMMLPNVGPGELPEDVNVVGLLQAKAAVGFIGACAIGTGVGLTAIVGKWIEDNSQLLFLYAMIGGAGTVLNTSISKLVQLNLSPTAMIALLALYALLSCLCLGIQAVANGTLPDPSLFVPVGAGVNLVLNFAAGLCIWGDGSRLQFPLSYAIVFVLVILGTYSVTSFDLVYGREKIEVARKMEPTMVSRGLPQEGLPNAVESVSHNAAQYALRKFASVIAFFSEHTNAHLDYERDPVHMAGVHLWKLWEDKLGSREDRKQALNSYLKLAIRNSLIDANGLAELCMHLLDEHPTDPDAFHSEALEQWLLKNVESFAECRKAADQEVVDIVKCP